MRQAAHRDGFSQENELHTLSSLGISSISLNAARLAETEIAGNTVTHEASFTINGQQQSIVDTWFDYNPTLTTNAASYELDVRAAFLPDLRGYGNIKDLHVALSNDNGAASSTLMSQMMAT